MGSRYTSFRRKDLENFLRDQDTLSLHLLEEVVQGQDVTALCERPQDYRVLKTLTASNHGSRSRYLDRMVCEGTGSHLHIPVTPN